MKVKKEKLIKYGIGVDMGKKKFHACIKSEWCDGHVKVVSTKSFDNTPGGHKAFYEWLEKNRKNKEVPYQILKGFLIKNRECKKVVN